MFDFGPNKLPGLLRNVPQEGTISPEIRHGLPDSEIYLEHCQKACLPGINNVIIIIIIILKIG